MGFFKNLVSKFPCELCGKEVGAINRTKLKDGKFICYDCRKNCSSFFSPVSYSLEEVKKHMETMEKYDEFCKEVFDKKGDKVDFAKLLQKTGIVLNNSLGMFEIISSDTKKCNYRELFRYDQVYDFKLYGVKNTGENASTKYKETGVKIKMISKKDHDVETNLGNYDKYKHEYATEFTIPCNYSTNTLDGGMLVKHLDAIFNVVAATKIQRVIEDTKGRSEYRKLIDLDKHFDRKHWKEVADNAEKDYFGKTIKEL